MTLVNQRDDHRRHEVESWLDIYGAEILALIHLYTGRRQVDDVVATLFEQVFLAAFTRYRHIAPYQSVHDALVHFALLECRVSCEPVAGPDGRDGPERPEIAAPFETGEAPSSTKSNTDAPSSSRRICTLTTAEKSVLIAALFIDGDLHRIASVLLRPHGMIRRIAEQAMTKLRPEARDDDCVQGLAALRAEVKGFLETVSVPEALNVRTRQMLLATMAQARAKARQEGPRWVTFGLIAIAGLSVCAVGFGVSRRPAVHAAQNKSPSSKTAAQLPPPLENLPGDVTAQFQLQGDIAKLPLSHLSVAADALYMPTLREAGDTWPSILVQKSDFTDAGGLLTDHLKDVGAIDMLPPGASDARQGNAVHSTNWRVGNWQFSVSGSFAVAVVDWVTSDKAPQKVTQLYVLSLPSGRSSLAKTWTSTKAGESHVVAVGGGRVVVQSEIHSGGAADANAQALSMPIDVYTLQGTDPNKAIGDPKHIPAPFGLMQQPSVTGGELVFQGITGQVQDQDAVVSSWYALSWDGQLSRYAGPPVDGRPHWAVKGASGTLWWVETTPDAGSPEHVQVLMAPLLGDASADNSPAVNLSGSVSFFTASDQSVAWVQTSENVEQLVIGELQ